MPPSIIHVDYRLTFFVSMIRDRLTGVLTVANQVAFDFESQTSYQLTLAVTDGGGAQDTASITVQLSDVDESTINVAPVVMNPPASVYYVDGQPAASLFVKAEIVDVDSTNLAGGRLRVENVSFPYGDDRLEFDPIHGITASSGDVMLNGTLIGTLSDDGIGRNALQVTLNQKRNYRVGYDVAPQHHVSDSYRFASVGRSRIPLIHIRHGWRILYGDSSRVSQQS